MNKIFLLIPFLLMFNYVFSQVETVVDTINISKSELKNEKITIDGDSPPPPPPPPPPLLSPRSEYKKVVEEMAQFPGCEVMLDKKEREICRQEKMLAFIAENIRYPEIAKNHKIEGMVVIRFIVEKDGSLTNIEVVRDIGAGCGSEALRVVNLMPNWIPAKLQQKAVRSQFNLPIDFKL